MTNWEREKQCDDCGEWFPKEELCRDGFCPACCQESGHQHQDYIDEAF